MFEFKKTVQSSFRFLSLLIVGLILFSTVDAKIFLVVGTPEMPFKFRDTHHKITGIDIDVVSMVLQELNIPHEFSIIDSGSRIISEAKEGNIDMVLSFSHKPSREEYLIYPEMSYKNVTWNFFIRKSDENKIIYNEISDLKSLRVGATANWSYTAEFWNSDLMLQVIPRNDLQISKLLAYRIDIVPMNTVATLYEEKLKGRNQHISYLPKPLQEKPYYNAFSRFSKYPNLDKISEKYSETLKKFIEEGKIKAVYSKYLD